MNEPSVTFRLISVFNNCYFCTCNDDNRLALMMKHIVLGTEGCIVSHFGTACVLKSDLFQIVR